MNYTVKEIAAITNSRFEGVDSTVNTISTDSRIANVPSSSVFVAIAGVNHDGHNFIDQQYQRGVRAFIIDRPVDTKKYPEAGFVIACNSLKALQELAAHHRGQFRGTVVAITGSNGKTVTKEWIAQLCPQGVKLFRSPKSYNSQLGVPLSVLMLEGDEKIAVIEAGISRKGEMANLEKIIAPDVGIFTNIGEAHQENFPGTKGVEDTEGIKSVKSIEGLKDTAGMKGMEGMDGMEEKLNEKLQLFRKAKTIIYNSDNPLVDKAMRKLYSDRRLIPVSKTTSDLDGLTMRDDASLDNAAQALALYDALGYDTEAIRENLPLLQSVAMRLELKEGINGCIIVNDSYNSDISSLSIALDYISSVAGTRERVLILSDILQSGLCTTKLYSQIARLVEAKGIARLVGIGEEISRSGHLFSCPKEFYPATEDFLDTYKKSSFTDKAILIKGSRPFHFERISRALERKIHTTVLEVNLDNMIYNLNYFREKLSPGVKVMAMVKAMGYGSGTYEVANMLQSQGVGYLAVAFADEGVTLREAGITMPIVVLNADSDSFELMIEYNLEPEIYSHTSLRSFANAARKQGETGYPVHIKLDSGMHRLGFERQDIDSLIAALKKEKELYISSIFSHLSSSDCSGEDDFTRSQIGLFSAMSETIMRAFPSMKILRHISNSAGIERFPEAQFDMVRLGIGLYGISAEHQENLLVASSLKTRIVQTKTLSEGETVGYGRHGKIKGQMRIATVPIGYADGLNRRLSRGNWALMVNGHKAPIIGNICMDTCMIDITGIDAAEGDSVTVFGENPTIIEMAAVLETIPYEILTGVSARVKRVYTKE